MYKYLLLFVFLLSINLLYAQDEIPMEIQDSITSQEVFMSAVKPSQSAFYSAILPGLGQVNNKDYWKVPIVYVALGTGIYFYSHNQDKFQDYRTAFKLLKLGEENDYPGISEETLQSAQEYHKKYRDLSILVTAGLYVLQIVEASVDAHLQKHNTEPNLSYRPVLYQDIILDKSVVGVGVTYTF